MYLWLRERQNFKSEALVFPKSREIFLIEKKIYIYITKEEEEGIAEQRDFPGVPVAKTSRSQMQGGSGSIPEQGTRPPDNTTKS